MNNFGIFSMALFLVINCSAMEKKRVSPDEETVAKRRRVLEALSGASFTLQYIKEDLGEEKFDFPEHVTPELKQELIPLFMRSKQFNPEQLEEYLHKKDLKKLYEIVEHANYFDADKLFRACKVVIAQKITRKEGMRKLLASAEFPLIKDVNRSLVPLCLSSAAKAHWLVKERMIANGSNGHGLIPIFLEENNYKLCSVAFNHAGSLVVAAGAGNDFEFWNPQTKSLVATLPALMSVGYSVAFNRDDTLLACGGSKGKVVIYDPIAYKHIVTHALEAANRIYSVAFNPTGQLLACGAERGRISLLHPISGAVVHTLTDQSNIYALAFDKNDTGLVSGSSDGALRLWDHHAGTLKKTFQDFGLGSIWSLSLNHDNTLLATGSESGKIMLWEYPSGNCNRWLRVSHFVQYVAFHPNNSLFISGDEYGNLTIYDARSFTKLQSLYYQGRKIRAIDFNSSGAAVACAYDDGSIGVIDVCAKEISDYLERDVTTPEALLLEHAYVLKRARYKVKLKVNKKILEKIPPTLRSCLHDALEIEIIE